MREVVEGALANWVDSGQLYIKRSGGKEGGKTQPPEKDAIQEHE